MTPRWGGVGGPQPPTRPSAASTTPASWAATALAWAAARASTITRTRGSVPLGRSSTRPSCPSSASALATASQTSAQSAQAPGLGDGHVDQHLGHPLDQALGQVGQGPAGPPHEIGQGDPGEDAVAGGRAGPEDDVPRLLPTQGEAVGIEGGQHVAVAHVGLADGDALATPWPGGTRDWS